MSKTIRLSSGEAIGVQFGRVASESVDALARRYYRDGLRLSDRLYNLDTLTRRTIEDTILQGVAEQVSARALGERLQGAITATGVASPAQKAATIARTEINHAHREAHVRACTDRQTGRLKSYIAGVRWCLSMSHPEPDICDVWADGHSPDLIEGVYLPEDVPVDHPHGLCFTMTVLNAVPEVSIAGQPAQAHLVPESQARYYANAGDPVAAAHVAAMWGE